MLNTNKFRHGNKQMNDQWIIVTISIARKSLYDSKALYKVCTKKLKITSINFQIYKYKTSSMKKGQYKFTWKCSVKKKRLQLIRSWRYRPRVEEFFGPKGSLLIQGAEFHSFGAETENARSPYAFKLEKGVAGRFNEDDPLTVA